MEAAKNSPRSGSSEGNCHTFFLTGWSKKLYINFTCFGIVPAFDQVGTTPKEAKWSQLYLHSKILCYPYKAAQVAEQCDMLFHLDKPIDSVYLFYFTNCLILVYNILGIFTRGVPRAQLPPKYPQRSWGKNLHKLRNPKGPTFAAVLAFGPIVGPALILMYCQRLKNSWYFAISYRSCHPKTTPRKNNSYVWSFPQL